MRSGRAEQSPEEGMVPKTRADPYNDGCDYCFPGVPGRTNGGVLGTVVLVLGWAGREAGLLAFRAGCGEGQQLGASPPVAVVPITEGFDVGRCCNGARAPCGCSERSPSL